MKQIVILFAAALVAAPALAQNKKPWYEHQDESRGVWGSDTRAEAKSKWQYVDYMRATATAIKKSNFNGDRVKTPNLRDKLNNMFGNKPIDGGVRFLDQPAAGFCTGFLIAPDILVTAGHCITNETDLQDAIWVFDYTSDVYYNKSEKYITIPQSNQYRGVEILATKLTTNDYSYDYCVIRLDRKTGRKPYKFRTGGEVSFDQIIAMIGSPKGLPLKVADSAHVTNSEDYSTYFLTDLDAFAGNSGGPVFNSNGYIEGILVRGPGRDYHLDESCDCVKQDALMDVYYLFGMNATSGNHVHRITKIPYNLLEMSVYRNLRMAIEDNNAAEFAEWKIYKWIWKKAIPNEESLLVVAAKNRNGDILNDILDIEGVDINVVDKYNTPLIHLMAFGNLGASITKISANAAFDINKRDANGETALMVAARNGNQSAVEALLRAGADSKAVNFAGKTARKIAKAAKQKAIASILKKAEKGKFK